MGTLHIPFWDIWSDDQTWVGTLHKALEQLEWGHHTILKENISWEGGTPHILYEQGDNRGRHRTSKFYHMFILGWGHRAKFQTLAVSRVGGWSGFAKNNATPWLHLAR